MNYTATLSITALILYFATLLFIVLKEKKNNTVMDFFFAGHSLSFWALSITFVASWWGAGAAISTADLGYSDGIGSFWYYGIPVLTSTFILIFISKFIRRQSSLTQGRMMRNRYNKSVAKLFSFFILLFMSVTASSQMVGMGDLFSSFLGWDYELSVIIGTSIVMVYSVFGGFRGVVLTDIIQFFLLLISALIVFGVAYYYSGGWEEIVAEAQKRNLTNYTNFFSGFEKYSVYVITFTLAWVIQANVWQRISAARNIHDAKKMTTMSLFIFIPLFLIVVLTGMAALAIYDTLPERGVVPTLITDYMNPAVGTLVFVGISAAVMSTMDSLVNTGAMTYTLDIHKKCSEKQQLKISKLATITIMIIGLVIALRIRSILEISWIASDIITTGLFVPFVAGFIWKRGTSQGAMASMVAGLVFCIWNLLNRLGVEIPIFWEPSSAYQVLIGFAASLVIFISVSLFTQGNSQN